eukprot:TRINITY_DN1499_c0_g1_i2.p2 TRINITY_DN1499_c0_g1~~TRINITY_DN1499_c0_g1_i2.p2  ORF type:complete len:221 (-),score=84.27 TRINITY_DN1499_c0_g1_i2:237-899(-)
MEAISHAGACVGILATDGVVLAAEKRVTSKLLEPEMRSDKMFQVDDHIACAVAGITADANILVNWIRRAAQQYTYNYQEPEPVELLVRDLCDLKQGYTQYGGLRPFGVSFLYAGWDRRHNFQLYHSDPSGNYAGWKATAIGNNNQAAQSLLKQEYKEEMDMEAACKLALQVIGKTMDSTNVQPEKLEFCTLTLEDGKPVYKELSNEEVEAIINSVELKKE